ncbi:MAG: hypothetical protein B7Y82_03700 [Sphingomonadales bacterium 32-65-25]|nr:MAG: hypothetical protein B7Y82_03700 [Sphingomonadales bacterium 32-65-25]
MTASTPLHVRLLNLLGAIRDLSPFDVLTAEEEQLLGSLIVRWHDEDNIAVSHVMRDLASVSQTTIYRRLISLRDKGFVRLRTDTADKRKKFVEPTPLSDNYAAQIANALGQIF